MSAKSTPAVRHSVASIKCGPAPTPSWNVRVWMSSLESQPSRSPQGLWPHGFRWAQQEMATEVPSATGLTTDDQGEGPAIQADGSLSEVYRINPEATVTRRDFWNIPDLRQATPEWKGRLITMAMKVSEKLSINCIIFLNISTLTSLFLFLSLPPPPLSLSLFSFLANSERSGVRLPCQSERRRKFLSDSQSKRNKRAPAWTNSHKRLLRKPAAERDLEESLQIVARHEPMFLRTGKGAKSSTAIAVRSTQRRPLCATMITFTNENALELEIGQHSRYDANVQASAAESTSATLTWFMRC